MVEWDVLDKTDKEAAMLERQRQAAFGVVDRVAGRIGWRAVALVARIPGRPTATDACAGCGTVGVWMTDEVGAWCPACGGR
jgi:hypothetical protein